MRRAAALLLPASLSTRMTLLLVAGVVAGATLALAVSERTRLDEAVRRRDDQVAAQVVALAAQRRADPPGFDARVAQGLVPGVRPAPAPWPARPDLHPRRALQAAFGPGAPEAALAPAALCLPAGAKPSDRLGACWFVRLGAPGGAARAFAVDLPFAHVYGGPLVDPVYLILMVGVGAGVAWGAARLTGAPLLRLTNAARAFGRTLDADPITVEGPREIRTALETFNQMQARMREAMRERTQILASVTHDLQTPLTRLRLRLEHVADPELRERLIDDLAVMQRLVREGLDLAESRESREPWSMLDLDSLLTSLAQDAADAGEPAAFVGGAGARVRTRPDALARCLQNLLDNALRHGGDAELSSRRLGQAVEVRVRDHGPGVPAAELEAVFEPFRQLDPSRSRSRGGTGLGLAIARAKAELLGAELRLANHKDGGLVATLSLPAG